MIYQVKPISLASQISLMDYKNTKAIIKKSKIDTIKSNVKYLLETYPETRKNDNLLFVYYIEKILNIPFTRDGFKNGYNQAVYKSIERARREVQSQYPRLKDKVTSEKREEVKNEYIEEYGNHRINIIT